MSEISLMLLLLVGAILGFTVMPEIGITIFMLLAAWWILVKVFSPRGKDD